MHDHQYCVLAYFWLNIFTDVNGVSSKLSPRLIITSKAIDYNAHCKIECGKYVQTHKEHDKSVQVRSTGVIDMQPIGNSQGGHLFFSLNTGRTLSRRKWNEFLMPGEVLERVHKISHRRINGVIFTDRKNHSVPGQ